MTFDALFTKIDELYPKYLQVWKDVCEIESPTADKAGVDAVGDYFEAFAKEKGWRVDRKHQVEAGDVLCITMNPEAPVAPLALSGHMDTVHEKGSFGYPAVTEDAEKLYGPGVTDCKGGLVVALLAMDALEQCGFRARPIQLLLQSEEEVASAQTQGASMDQLCEWAKGAIGFLNLEMYTPNGAVIVRKGGVNFTFSITGQRAHGANCAIAGASAIAEAAHKIVELEKLKDNDGITCNCGVIQGGTAANTVPDFCEFKANIRFATQEQFDWVCEHVQKIADTVYVKGCSCRLTRALGHPSMDYTERTQQLLDAMNDIWERHGMPRLSHGRRNGASDAACVTLAGIPCVDSIGVEGGCLHALEEFAVKESLKSAAKRVATVAVEI